VTRELPIAFFDSGVGGLSVLKSLVRALPNENIVYFADDLRSPYGFLPREEVYLQTSRAIKFFEALPVKLILIACHTASVHLNKGESSIPIVDMRDGVFQILDRATSFRRIGILGTSITVESGVYSRPHTFSTDCSPFVSWIEEGCTEIEAQVKGHLRFFNGDAALLACTHFPWLQDQVGKALGPAVSLLDPADKTVEEVKRVLQTKKLLSAEKTEEDRFFVTKNPEKFRVLAERLLGNQISSVNLIDLKENFQQ